MKVFLVAAAVALLLSPSGGARADDQGRGAAAEAAMKRGQALLQKSDYSDALDAFREAHELLPSARTTAQIGNALIGLDRLEEAEEALEEALIDRVDPWVQKNRPALEEMLRRAQEGLGDLVIVGAPAGAALRLNGEFIGFLPMKSVRHVRVGPAVVRVEHSGYTPRVETVEIKAGKVARVEVSLVAVPAPKPAAAAVAPVDVALARSPDAVHPTESPGLRTFRTFLWSVLAVGAVSSAVGLPLYLKNDRSDAAAILLGLGGGGVFAGGGFLLLLEATEPDPGPRVALGPTGIRFATRF